MKRLTPEREKEIRSKYFCSDDVHDELLEEIDALRLDYKNSLQDTVEAIRGEDALRLRISNLKEVLLDVAKAPWSDREAEHLLRTLAAEVGYALAQDEEMEKK